jgi:phosphoribosylaminoimidazole-succinocarboxamide synthase
MRKLLQSAIGTSQFDVPGLADNSVVIAAENLKTIPVENVLRAYMAKSSTSTSLYQAYVIRGERTFAGHKLPEWLVTNGPLPYVMDTPSTKSDEHDATIDMEYLVKNNLCTPEQYVQIRNAGIFAFGMISQYLRARGIIAVDTKTEHGINRKGEIVSQDEIWTMDSSRFWLANDYKEQLEKFQRGEIKDINPKSYSKEFARGFSEGEKGYTDEQRIQIAIRYIIGIQHLLSKPFDPDPRQRDERVISGLETVVKELVA